MPGFRRIMVQEPIPMPPPLPLCPGSSLPRQNCLGRISRHHSAEADPLVVLSRAAIGEFESNSAVPNSDQLLPGLSSALPTGPLTLRRPGWITFEPMSAKQLNSIRDHLVSRAQEAVSAQLPQSAATIIELGASVAPLTTGQSPSPKQVQSQQNLLQCLRSARVLASPQLGVDDICSTGGLEEELRHILKAIPTVWWWWWWPGNWWSDETDQDKRAAVSTNINNMTGNVTKRRHRSWSKSFVMGLAKAGRRVWFILFSTYVILSKI
ncbi:unnamed protein product [Protopolystoma xenopodis]|uniref:Uncharacterized protein n=1 Tax=Protopolystoma xenopodis TaxID=117903 RepID=A0A3S5FCC4_9PLAT|nr:unnamed protein product [Protopolystoma xenopodis]